MKRKLIKSAAILTTASAVCFFGYSFLPGTYNGVYDRKEIMHYAQQHKHEFESVKNKQLPSRQDQLDNLEMTNFDVVVIGGGATGTGVALDAVTRGNLKVALLEKTDFAYGTSSRATKMAHGGVRYLEKAVMNLDPKEVNLVYECLRERKHFFQVAPHLVSALPILTPCYTAWDSFKMFVGLRLYDILSGNSARIGKSEWVSKDTTLEINPLVKKANLYGSMKYYDAIFNDARMNLSLALTSALHGATVLNHCEVVQLLKDDSTKKLKGLVVRDTLTNKTYQVSAKVIVNATGAFSDAIRKMDDPNTHNIIKPSLGAHLILDKKYTPGGIGILYPKTTDGRVLYLLPWENATIAGTTDKGLDSITDKPPVQQEDVQFILKELKQQLEADFDEKKDVLSSWSGFRPLVSVPPIEKTYASNSQATTIKTKDNNVAQISRDHYIEVSDSNLITICGGKWTSFRKMAEDTIDVAVQIAHLTPKYTHSKTRHTLLVGAHDLDPYVQDGVMLDNYNNLLRQQDEKLALDEATLAHLKHYYGDRSIKIMNMVLENNKLQAKLSPKYPFIEAEVIYHIEHEYACTALDVVTTRTNLMFLDKNVTMEVLPKIVQIMARHLKWSRQRQEQELASAKQYIANCTK